MRATARGGAGGGIEPPVVSSRMHGAPRVVELGARLSFGAVRCAVAATRRGASPPSPLHIEPTCSSDVSQLLNRYILCTRTRGGSTCHQAVVFYSCCFIWKDRFRKVQEDSAFATPSTHSLSILGLRGGGHHGHDDAVEEVFLAVAGGRELLRLVEAHDLRAAELLDERLDRLAASL